MSIASGQGQAVTTIVHTPVRFYIEDTHGKKHKAFGRQVYAHNGFVTIVDHEQVVVKAIAVDRVVSYGKAK